MTIDILLGLIFLSSFLTLWYKISVKIPELVAVPDSVILARLEEDSARFRLFILKIKTFYKERELRRKLRQLGGKLLYRFHIFLMRVDNVAVAALKKLKENGVPPANPDSNGSVGVSDYLKTSDNGFVKSGRESAGTERTRIQEVRVKK